MYLETMRGLGQAPMVVSTADGPVTCDPNVSYPEGHACTASEQFWSIEQLARWGRLFPSGQEPARTPARTDQKPPPFDLGAWLKTNQTPVLVGSAALLAISVIGGRRR